jgi:hypothetical protein
VKRNRGRPKGYVMSEKSKAKIAKSKTGQIHAPETKDKISQSLVKHFDKKGRRHPMAFAKSVKEGDFDPNTIELVREFIEVGHYTRGMFNALDLELVKLTVAGAFGLDGKQAQSEYYTDSVAGINGINFSFSMRKRGYYELPKLKVPGEHFYAVRRNMAEQYPSMPLRLKDVTIRHNKSGSIYKAEIRSTVKQQVDKRKLIITRMNSKKHTDLTPAEYGGMQDDLMAITLRQCYYSYQIVKSGTLCSIEVGRKKSSRKR